MAVGDVWAELGRPSRSQPRMALAPVLAGGMAAGILCAQMAGNSTGRWGWLAFGLAMLLVAAAARCFHAICRRLDDRLPLCCPSLAQWMGTNEETRRRILIALLLGLGATGLAAAWSDARLRSHTADALVLRLDNAARLMRVRGLVVEGPEEWKRPAGDVLAHPGRSETVARFMIQVDAVLGSGGSATPASGRLRVYVDGDRAALHHVSAGSRIEATGWSKRIARAMNPGQFDGRTYFESRAVAGRLSVADASLVRVLDDRPAGLRARWHAMRAAVHERARRALLGDGAHARGGADNAHEHAEAEALLEALLLGRRGGTLVETQDAMGRLGIAHLLAISGLHLGLLAGMAYGALRWLRIGPRWAAGVLIVLVLAYLFGLEVRAPIIRAAVMTVLVLLGVLMGRRWVSTNLLCAGAVVILVWRPVELFAPGFQLTFAVVWAILHLRAPLQRMMFGEASPDEWRLSRVLWHKLAQWIAVATAAWLVSAPIALAHFGYVGLLAIPLSILGVPIVAALLALGIMRMGVGLVWPDVTESLARPMDVVIASLLDLVRWMDELPGATLSTPRPSPWWAAAAIAMIILWLHGPRWWRERTWRMRLMWRWRIGSAAVLLGVLAQPIVWPALEGWRQRDMLRIDSLAVGDGACHIVRCGGKVMVIDAGSGTYDGIGRHVIVPAMRELGVGRIDLLCITHGDLDHFSGVVDIVREMRVDAMAVTEATMMRWRETEAEAETESDEVVETDGEAGEAAQADAPRAAWGGGGLLRVMLDEVEARKIPIETRRRDDAMKLGEARVHWLHPSADAEYERDNDGSLVTLVRFGGRRLLFTGDVEAEGIGELMARWPDARVDVLELPHHGAFHDAATGMTRWLRPGLVLQSAGNKRWREDRWAPVLAAIEAETGSHVERWITARDGMVTVTVDGDGRIGVRGFRDTMNRATK